MKKLFALILVICVITLTFASCDIASIVNKVITTEEPTDDPTLPKTYTYGVMNITLPAGFKEVKEGVFKNDEVSVRCVRMLFSSIPLMPLIFLLFKRPKSKTRPSNTRSSISAHSAS